MEKQYGTRSRENMPTRKRKFYHPPKMRIHPKMNNGVKQSKIHHAKKMVKTMENTHLDMRDHECLHVTIQYGPKLQHNMMRNPLVTTILAQYHLSKRLKVFGDTGVSAVLKELK